MIDIWGIPCDIALRWMSMNLTDDKPMLSQVYVDIRCHYAKMS